MQIFDPAVSVGGFVRIVVGQAELNEEPVVAIMLGAFQGFGCDGDDAGAAFAGAFREQLLDPEAEPGNPGRCHQGELVATVFGQSTDDGSQPSAGIFTYGPDSDASTLHGFSGVQQSRQIDSHERGGHQAEIGEDGISAADVGIIDEGASKTAGFSQPFQGGTRVGHGDEVVAGVGRTAPGFRKVSEMGVEGQRLGGGPGFGRD